MSIKGSYSLWHTYLTRSSLPGLSYRPDIDKVVDLPDAILPNGLYALNKSQGVLIAADAIKGTIFSINMHTRIVVAAIHDPLMAPVSSSSVEINGINVVRGSIYFTNTGLNVVG